MDASQLLSDGIPVALADGAKVTIRFDFEAMLRLEASYGSTFAFVTDLDARLKGRGFSAVLAGMQAGVKERQITSADLDPSAVLDYRQAIVEAWLEAMPEPKGDAGKARGRAEDGIGSGSTSSEPSGSAEATPSGDE